MFQNFSLWPLALVASSCVIHAEDLLGAMGRYEGRWVGHFTLHSVATGYTETFSVEQQYWMADDKLHGVAVSERDSGMQTARSVTSIVDDKLVSVITQGVKIERYLGVLHENGVLWLPEKIERANDHQLKETILVEEGELRLKTEGFDTYIYEGGLAHIVYRGNLIFKR
ncbi:MAG: hypothetical protein ABF322_03760 [Lentimonas sp.]